MKKWAFIPLLFLLLGMMAGCMRNRDPVSWEVVEVSGKAVQVKDGTKAWHKVTIKNTGGTKAERVEFRFRMPGLRGSSAWLVYCTNLYQDNIGKIIKQIQDVYELNHTYAMVKPDEYIKPVKGSPGFNPPVFSSANGNKWLVNINGKIEKMVPIYGRAFGLNFFSFHARK